MELFILKEANDSHGIVKNSKTIPPFVELSVPYRVQVSGFISFSTAAYTPEQRRTAAGKLQSWVCTGRDRQATLEVYAFEIDAMASIKCSGDAFRGSL